MYTNIKFIGFVGTKKAKQKCPLKMSAHNNMLFINCIKICFKMNEFFIWLSYLNVQKKKKYDWSNYECPLWKMICHCYEVNDKKL